jgi:hypothetical protein
MPAIRRSTTAKMSRPHPRGRRSCCLAIEFEIKLGLGASVSPILIGLQFLSSEGPLRSCGPLDGHAHTRRLTRDTAFLWSGFGGGDDAARDEAFASLVLACEDEYDVAFGDAFAPIHRFLRAEDECLRPGRVNFGFDRVGHCFSSMRENDNEATQCPGLLRCFSGFPLLRERSAA